MNKGRNIVLLSVITLSLIALVGGLTYAIDEDFNPYGTKNNKVLAGDIYVHYSTSDELVITKMSPRSTYDPDTYFEFTIDGKNESTKNIIYDIVVEQGSNHATRTERIADRFLKFRLVEIVNNEETELAASKSFDFLTSTSRLYVNTINANTRTEVVHNYKLYVWISDEILIGNTPNANYSIDTWNNQAYASVKVAVNGDFDTKALVIDSIENRMKSSAQSDANIKFYQVNGTNNGNGLFVRSGTTTPIYYYRGNVNNNNVLFGNFCWKIVRTTDTGGVKMIYNGSPTLVNGEKHCLETTGDNTQLSETAAFKSSPYHDPTYAGYSYGTSYSYTGSCFSGNSTIKVSKSFTYDGTNYILNDTEGEAPNQVTISKTVNSEDWGSQYNTLSNAHYTCSNESGICNTIKYIYYTSQSVFNPDCLIISDGKGVEEALNEMIRDNSNTKDHPSTIQSTINTWYETNLKDNYAGYLEDTEWCNDRSATIALGGWNPDGGATTGNDVLTGYNLNFDVYLRYNSDSSVKTQNYSIWQTNSPVLSCSNPNDRLSVANGQLKYPISLLTYDEVALAGGVYLTPNNTNYYLYTNKTYWLLSPAFFTSTSSGSSVGSVDSYGSLSRWPVSWSEGVRPVISLKPRTEIIKGNGESTSPYVITE